MEKLKNIKGATLLELMIVIAISVILVSSALPIFGNFQTTSQLNDTTEQVVQTLRVVRGKSLSGFNNSAHGVYFQNDRFISYQGSSYVTRQSAYDLEILLAPPVSISTNIVGDDINFSKGLGVPNATGTIFITHNTSGTKNININEFGLIGF